MAEQNATKEERIKRVDVTLIRDNPFQLQFRRKPATLEEKEEERKFLLRLAESIRTRDLFHLLVFAQTKDGEIRLVSGTARRDALLLAMKQFPEEKERFRYPLCLFLMSQAQRNGCSVPAKRTPSAGRWIP